MINVRSKVRSKRQVSRQPKWSARSLSLAFLYYRNAREDRIDDRTDEVGEGG